MFLPIIVICAIDAEPPLCKAFNGDLMATVELCEFDIDRGEALLHKRFTDAYTLERTCYYIKEPLGSKT